MILETSIFSFPNKNEEAESLMPTSLLYVRPAELPLTVLFQLDTLPVLYFCFLFFEINYFLYIVLIACIIFTLRAHPDFFFSEDLQRWHSYPKCRLFFFLNQNFVLVMTT